MEIAWDLRRGTKREWHQGTLKVNLLPRPTRFSSGLQDMIGSSLFSPPSRIRGAPGWEYLRNSICIGLPQAWYTFASMASIQYTDWVIKLVSS